MKSQILIRGDPFFQVCVGAKTYKLVRSLVAPEDPKDKSYADFA